MIKSWQQKMVIFMSTIKQKVIVRITRTRKKSVFIRSDFNDIGGYDQVGRVLRVLTKDGLLIKMGYGVYVKARRNRFTNEIMPDIDGGIDAAFIEALNQLNVDFDFDRFTKKYMSGEMTQIPVNMKLNINKRFSRKLAIGNVALND